MATSEDPEQIEPLVDAARQGDGKALSELLRRLWPWLRKKARYFIAKSAPPIGVSTLTQETALRLSRSIRKVRANDSPAVKALLTRIMKNTGNSAHRAAYRQKRDPAIITLEDLFPTALEPSDQQLERAQREQYVIAAIERLPVLQRQAVNLLRAGATYPEIAEQLGRPLSAIHMIFQRAKAGLTEALRELDSLS